MGRNEMEIPLPHCLANTGSSLHTSPTQPAQPYASRHLCYSTSQNIPHVHNPCCIVHSQEMGTYPLPFWGPPKREK